jgi:5'-nucleotidase
MKRGLLALCALLLLLAVTPVASAAPQKDSDTYVQLLAINDFHGNLQPPSGSSGRISVAPGATVDAGGPTRSPSAREI